jgi:hypothetical protein
LRNEIKEKSAKNRRALGICFVVADVRYKFMLINGKYPLSPTADRIQDFRVPAGLPIFFSPWRYGKTVSRPKR